MKTILGTILLLGGILIILAVLFFSYQIFTAKIQAPKVFKTDSLKNQEFAPENKEFENKQNINENQIQKIIQMQIEKILPQKNVFQLLNILSWSLFSMLAIFGGEKIALLGIKLLK